MAGTGGEGGGGEGDIPAVAPAYRLQTLRQALGAGMAGGGCPCGQMVRTAYTVPRKGAP